jgi:molybdopterin-synthase adenylyltransferase
MKSRYLKNENMLSRKENQLLHHTSVAIVGCGGLGGYIIEMLARLGIGRLTVIDGDVFEASNLNRQLLATSLNMGKSKAEAALQRIQLINPDVEATLINEFISSENASMHLTGHDVICDALDNIPSRRLLQTTAESLNIPLVYGAIAGWYAHISTIFPGDGTLDKLYPEDFPKGIETELGNPSFTPALAASLQVAEVLKVILGKTDVLRNKLLTINTLEMKFEVLEL